MDILRTSLQQQSDQMLQELEARINRSHSYTLSTLNEKHKEELFIQKSKMSGLQKQLAVLKASSSEMQERYSKFEEVSPLFLFIT